MAEYIKILEYCEQTGLNKSKVYRAINSGKIKTKKIDGVMFINVSLLPDKFKLPESEPNVESKTKVEKVEIETTSPTCEVVSVGNDIQDVNEMNERGYITIRHYEILQELYNKLETRTQVALDAQEDSIKILKKELVSKNEEIEKLLQEKQQYSMESAIASNVSEEVVVKEVAVIPGDIEKSINEKQQKIEELENQLNEKQESINKLENDLIPAQDKVLDLENQLSELQTKIFEFENQTSDEQILDQHDEMIDKSYVDEMESQLNVLRRQLDSYQQELAEKQKIIDEHQMSQKRDEFVTVLGGINNQLDLSVPSSVNSDEFDKIIYEKQSRIDDLEIELSTFRNKVSLLEQKLLENQPVLDEDDILQPVDEEDIFNIIEEESPSVGPSKDIADVNKHWEALLNEKQKIIYDLENQLFEKQQRILSFDNTNKAQREINRLLSELDVSNGKVKKLQEENKRLMYEIPGQEGLSVDVQQRFTFYHNEMTDLQSKIQRLELDLREKNDIIVENDAIIKDKELRIKDIQDIADKRKNRIDDLKKELVSKHLKISQMGEISHEASLIPNFSSSISNDSSEFKNQLMEKEERIKFLESELKNKELMIPTEGFGNADSVINALKEELEAAKLLLTDTGDSKTIDKLSNLVNQKEEEIAELTRQLEELKSSTDQSLFNNGLSLDLENTKDEKIEFLETDLKSKIDYIEMLEKTLNNMDKQKEGLITSGVDEKVEQLTQELEQKAETISQLECKVAELEKFSAIPEILTSDDTEVQIQNELLEKDEIIKCLEKQLDEMKIASLNSDNASLISESSSNDFELQNKINEYEEELRLKSEQILELESKLVFDFEPSSLDSSETDSKIKTLELQIDSLIDDNNRKSQLIEELQYGQSTNACDKTALGLDNNDSELELEKYRLVNEQMKNAMDSKETEINQLKKQLEDLETELNDKTSEIKKERQKTISIALSKSKGLPGASEEDTLAAEPGFESTNKVKSLELEIIKLNEYIDSLKFQNIQLKQQNSQPQPPRGSDDSGGWLNKL